MTLQMYPDCEKCGRDLPPASHDALICSFECTFCTTCADAMDFTCPNCGGDLKPRPSRARHHLDRHPPSLERKHKAGR